MMTTLLTTIANALIDFILSLLRDPAALDEFQKDPDGTLARHGLSGVSAADVQAVSPVVIDHPQVHPRDETVAATHQIAAAHTYATDPIVIREITRMAQTFHVDNRSTIIDQSVNQSIWADGDVTQQFDHEAVLASGDGSNAAGHDVDDSTTTTTMGDVSLGNTDTTVTIDDSYNDSSTDTTTSVDADVDGSYNDSSSQTDVDTTVTGSFNGDGAGLAVAAASDGGTTGDAAPADAAPADDAPADDAGPADAALAAAPDPTVLPAEVGVDDGPDDAGGAYVDAEPPMDVAFDEP